MAILFTHFKFYFKKKIFLIDFSTTPVLEGFLFLS